MSYNVGQLKIDLQAILSTADLTKISGPDPLIERAARDVLLDTDPFETVRDEQIGSPVQKQQHYYPAPSDLKGNSIIDIYKQGDQPDDSSFFEYDSALNARKNKTPNTFTVEMLNGVHFIRLNKGIQNYSIFDRISDTENFTLTNIDGLRLDKVQFIEGGSSVAFNLIAGQSNALIEKNLQQSFNIEEFSDGSVFLWVFLPNADNVTDVSIRVGNNNSNYFTETLTSTASNTQFDNGWNLIKLDISNATEQGTVDLADISYYAVGFSYNGNEQKNVRIDYLTFSRGEFYRIKYYSNSIFRDSMGMWSAQISGDSDFINLDVDSYNLLLYKSASYFIQHQHDFNYKPNNSEADVFERKYRQALEAYKARYKSEKIKKKTYYY